MARIAPALWVVGVLAVAGVGTAKTEPLPALAYASDTFGNLDVYVLRPGASKARRLTSSQRDEFSPSWSPDGRRVAYRVNPPRDDTGDIWVMRSDGTRKANLTRTPNAAEWSPAWSPDGRLIAYFSSVDGGDVWVVRPDGRGRRNVTREGTLNEYPSWSPDGRQLAFNSHRDGQFEIYRARLDGSRQANLTRHPAKDQWPAWSPDGSWIAFMSEREGNPDVFVMRVDGSSPRNVTRTPGLEESHPVWLPDGRLSFTRHGTTGPIELWATRLDGVAAVRLEVGVEPVFVYDWKR
jgi:Tol biopolymer transport system component